MDMVEDHQTQHAPSGADNGPGLQETAPPSTAARPSRPGPWEVHPTIPVPMHTGHCCLCAAYFDHLCQDMAFGARDLQDALHAMSRKTRQLQAECDKKEQEILQLRMTASGMMHRIEHYERRIEGRDARHKLVESGNAIQMAGSWEPQTGQKRPAPADAPAGDERRDHSRSVPPWAMVGNQRDQGSSTSAPSRETAGPSRSRQSDQGVGQDRAGLANMMPPAESAAATLGGWPASQSPWSQPSDYNGMGVPTAGPGGATMAPPPSQGPRNRGTARRLFHFFDGASSAPPSTQPGAGPSTSSTGGSGGGSRKGQGTHAKGHGAAKKSTPSMRWDAVPAPSSGRGRAPPPTLPSVVYEATRQPVGWEDEDESDEEEERDVPVRLANNRFAVINPTNRRQYLDLTYDQFVHWYDRPVKTYKEAKKKAVEMTGADVAVPKQLQAGTPSESAIELIPLNDGLWGFGSLTILPPSDDGPLRIVPITTPLTLEDGRTMIGQAQASLEGSIERIRLVRVALAARQTSRRTAGEVLALESIASDLIPPYPPYPGGTPEPPTATFSQVLEFYRAHPNGETPRGIRRHGGNPVPADVEAFHVIRAIGPQTKEKEKQKEKEKAKEKDNSPDNSPTRLWRLAAARVLSDPMGYENFVTGKRITINPPPEAPRCA